MTFDSFLQQIKSHKEEIKKLRELIKKTPEQKQKIALFSKINFEKNKDQRHEQQRIYHIINREKINKRRNERRRNEKNRLKKEKELNE